MSNEFFFVLFLFGSGGKRGLCARAIEFQASDFPETASVQLLTV